MSAIEKLLGVRYRLIIRICFQKLSCTPTSHHSGHAHLCLSEDEYILIVPVANEVCTQIQFFLYTSYYYWIGFHIPSIVAACCHQFVFPQVTDDHVYIVQCLPCSNSVFPLEAPQRQLISPSISAVRLVSCRYRLVSCRYRLVVTCQV